MEFKKDIKLELKDLLDFSYSKVIPRLTLLSLIIAIVSIAVLFLIERSFLFEDLLGTLVIIVITVVLFALLTIVLLKRSNKKQYESTQLLRANAQITINKEGFSRKNEFEQVFIKWNDIFAVYEVRNSYNIYVSNLASVLIPKRLLTSQEEITLRHLINNNLDPKKNKLRKR